MGCENFDFIPTTKASYQTLPFYTLCKFSLIIFMKKFADLKRRMINKAVQPAGKCRYNDGIFLRQEILNAGIARDDECVGHFGFG